MDRPVDRWDKTGVDAAFHAVRSVVGPRVTEVNGRPAGSPSVRPSGTQPAFTSCLRPETRDILSIYFAHFTPLGLLVIDTKHSLKNIIYSSFSNQTISLSLKNKRNMKRFKKRICHHKVHLYIEKYTNNKRGYCLEKII